jgi:S1-C subfamily serine protease
MFVDFACAMADIEVEDEAGEIGVGSAFHVGEGVFVTARHVVENFDIREVGSTEARYVPIEESEESLVSVVENGIARPVHTVRNEVLNRGAAPFSIQTVR